MTKHQKTRSNKNDQQKKKESNQQHKIDQESQHTKKQQEIFSLYDVIGVKKDATKEQIKKQYRAMAMVCHPDKNKQDPIKAKQKFQKLKEAYDILSDDDKRKQYDQTGTYGEQFNINAFQSAYQYYRQIYKKVSEQDILNFQKQYREGKMEQEDLLDYYQKNEGNMVQLIESIPCSKNEDIRRFIKFFQDKIALKQIKKYKAFDMTKNKVRQLKDQSEQFEKMKSQQKKNGMSQLALAIRNKGNSQMDFIKSLQQKYGGKKKAQKETKIRKNKKQ